ncbi:MAG: sialate O-acetylesterase [Kiritimatiellia bacterium]
MRLTLLLLTVCFGALLPAKTLHVYLLTGQSNSLGAIKGNHAEIVRMRPTPSKILFWQENFGSFVRTDPPHTPQWEKVRPQKAAHGGVVMGLEYGFAQRLEAQNVWPMDDIAIIKVSRDGGGNHYWMDGGEARTAVMAALNNALTRLPRRYLSIRLEAVLYLQGESDKGEEITAAADRFCDFFEAVKTAFGRLPGADSSNAKAILGENATWFDRDTTEQGKTTRDELKALAERREEIGWVPTRDLTKIKTGDQMGVHYDGNAQLTIGQRFADEALTFQKKTLSR